MAEKNIVFLIDINSIPRRGTGAGGGLDQKPVVKLEAGREGDSLQNVSLELIPYGAGRDAISLKEHQENLEWLKIMVMLTLHKESNDGKDYDCGKVQWTFKFFDSSRHVDFRDGRSFMPFDYESFSNFERQVDVRMPKPASENNPDSQQAAPSCGRGVKYLSDAIKVITGSLPWPEGQSLDTSKIFEADEPTAYNSVIVFHKVPRTESDLIEYAGSHAINSTKDFANALLSSAFSHRFHHKLKIQLNFVDMWTAPNNFDLVDAKWDGSYPRQITRCLRYLGGGTVSSIEYAKLIAMDSQPTFFGLLSYSSYLRSQLQKCSIQNENVPMHIKKLDLSKPGQKVSPDDTSLVSRSNRSTSILENSMNNQSKVRPYRPSSGFMEDDLAIHKRKMASIKAQDSQREGDRKRKRQDYDEDYYDSSALRRHSGNLLMDEMDYDPDDSDSQCEKEQRVKGWVNDASFLPKRKKSLDTTTSAVPMSRSGLNKSHVFNEPAPKSKLPGSRGEKMLATVVRQQNKVTAVQSKRRSNEGMDMKRIAQQQERALSAIKRRLKSYLVGELEDVEDPVAWLKSFKKLLRSFAERTLQEEDPCLVALAQALVNLASVEFTTARVQNIKAAYRSKSMTAKELLEDILLIDFPILNKKIISAHEVREKSSSSTDRTHARKVLAFRETELQIIMLLEIAWCFVEQDEDAATDELITKIVRLLQIIAAYRTQPPIDHFINSVLFPTYRQSSRFLKEVYKRMNIPLPAQLAVDGSPLPGSSRLDDDASVISSTSSAYVCPEDSASQLHLHQPKRFRHSTGNRMQSFSNFTASTKRREMRDSGSKKPMRQFMVATISNPKFAASTSQYNMEATNSQRRVSGVIPKASPKRVRRNLFDVKKNDKKDNKTLLALSTASRLTKSPAFKSPKAGGKSPSGFFRAARSKRKLVLTNEESNQQFGSPSFNSDVLCPESPATPGGRLSGCSKYAATTASGGSSDRHLIIQESPELPKNEYDNRPMTTVASLSFYSTGNKSSKSRAWEKSETQLLAARIKDSVDLRSRENQELGLSDLEIFPQANVSASTTSPTVKSICYDSTCGTAEKQPSPFPVKTESDSFLDITGPAPDLNNPSIEALITTSTPFPLVSKDFLITMPLSEPQFHQSPSGVTASPSNLQTPSKRVQFNLNENLVNTPASARRSSNNGTPKSILKEAQDV